MKAILPLLTIATVLVLASCHTPKKEECASCSAPDGKAVKHACPTEKKQ